jgi:hypothetical protein
VLNISLIALGLMLMLMLMLMLSICSVWYSVPACMQCVKCGNDIRKETKHQTPVTMEN